MTKKMTKTNEIKYISPEAITYAKALMELGFSLETVDNIKAIFNQVPELLQILINPGVDPIEKRSLINKLFDKLEANFINLLIDKNRLPLIFEILEASKQILLKGNGTVKVRLSYVSMPSDLQLQKMEKILKDKLNVKEITWEFTEDPTLLGGFILDAGDLFFDYSVKGRLDEMKNQLIGR